MAHKLIVRDTITGQCGLADPICPAVSTDPNNILILGTDGETFLDCSAIKGCESLTSLSYNSANYELTFTDENGDTTVVNLAALAADIFVTGATYDASTGVLTLTDNDTGTPDLTVNLAALISQLTNNNDGSYTHTSGDGSVTVINVLGNEAGNLLTISSNGGVSIIPSDIVSGICGDATAKAALVSCLEDDINTDTSLVLGTQTVNADGSITQCFTTTALDGSTPNGVDDVCFVIPASASRMEVSADGCTIQHFDGQNVATGPALVMRNEDQSGTFYLQVNIPTIPDSDLQLIAAATGWVEVATVELDYDNPSSCRDMSSMFVTRGGNPQFVYNSGDGDDVQNEPFYQVRYRAISGGLPTPIIAYDFSGKDDQNRIYFPTQTEPDGEITAAGGSGSIGYAIDIQITDQYIPNPLNRISLFVNRIHGLWVLK